MSPEKIQQLRQMQQDDHHYQRDEPIWLLHDGNEQPDKATFVMYRQKKVIIDVLIPSGTRRRMAYLKVIRPRNEQEA